MKLVKLTAAAITIAALTACASSGLNRKDEPQFKYVDYAGEPIDDFTTFGLDSWSAVSRTQLVVWDGVNRAYLLTVWDSCRDLKFANTIAVTSTSRTVSKFEKVVAEGDSCPIQEIRPIDVKQLKADRRAAAEVTKAARAAEKAAPTP
jgi:hypothetical protein